LRRCARNSNPGKNPEEAGQDPRGQQVAAHPAPSSHFIEPIVLETDSIFSAVFCHLFVMKLHMPRKVCIINASQIDAYSVTIVRQNGMFT
jgi:hypothetical protein